ncbi:MAG TPA: hypothetical protein VJ725_14245 [Thermoanaerobaculia bacterium]|nr:hypothetical protein [Thermoanaerobaculia bacterium]
MLREILEKSELTKEDLCRELKVDKRTVDKLLKDNDKENWRLNRAQFYRYALFAHEHGYDAFRVVVHPIWRTFEHREGAKIFRGPRTAADVPVESHLTDYFQRLHSDGTQSMMSSDVSEVAGWMKSSNCVFIGSPKASPASEIALALLWGAEPFSPRPENRDRIPIHFLGMIPDNQRSSASVEEGPRHGLAVQVHSGEARSFLKVDRIPAAEYAAFEGEGQDAAVLVACNRPLGTDKDVTTIVIAGYSGPSTLAAAQEATSKGIPDLRPDETPGQPVFAVMKVQSKKKRQFRKSLDGLRTPIAKTAKWGPPWPGFFST